MRLLNILSYFAQVSEIMNRRDSAYTSEELNSYNEQLASMSENFPFQEMGLSDKCNDEIYSLA